ncbi:MAG: gamma-glutamylcyclotransferase [Candidatus Lambdaproteobacteria bacterium]|nr:gamma-glutamylcyclotransferase [Candidatus Lambdaproteobacteria bacterium]
MYLFGYGSLMWRPEVAYKARRAALLTGYHRAYVMFTTKARGSKDAPGMMLGLAPGGECWGVAFEIEQSRAAETLAAVDKREGVGRANWRVLLPVRIDDADDGLGRDVLRPAWTYMPWPAWENYCGLQPRPRMVELIATGVGERGSAYEYLRCVNQELHAIGHPDPGCQTLLDDVERFRAESAS